MVYIDQSLFELKYSVSRRITMKSLILIVSLVTLSLVSAKNYSLPYCPEKLTKLLSPCYCNVQQCDVTCIVNDTKFDVNAVFDKLSKGLEGDDRQLDCLILSSAGVKELGEDVFKGISFQGDINILSNPNLVKVHGNAFKSSINDTKILDISNNKISDARSLFTAVSSFTNLWSVTLENNDIQEIPDNAFRPVNGFQHNLWQILIRGKSIERIGDNAFTALKNAETISVTNTSVTHVSDKALEFDVSPDKRCLRISLVNDGNVTSAAFDVQALTKFKRQTCLVFEAEYDPEEYPNQVSYLDEKVFRPFFQAHSNNTISVHQGELDAKDSRNAWILKDKSLSDRIATNGCTWYGGADCWQTHDLDQ